MNIHRIKFVMGIGIAIIGALFLISLLLIETRVSLHDEDIALQNEENICGPIALKMIFDHYGINCLLPEIKSKVPLSKTGASMLALKNMAELKGLHAEGWRLTLEDLLEKRFPIILFVSGNHYVVADSVLNDTLFYRDPTYGKSRMPIETLPKIWNGETLVFKEI
jgi:ATP-binding cassette subfamily B protein